MIVPFVGGSYEYRSRGVSHQRSVNLFPENVESPEGKAGQVLVHTPGEILVGNIGNGVCRALYYSSSGFQNQASLYAVYGNEVFRIAKGTYVSTKIGEVQNGASPISIVDNGFRVYVADGNALFSFDMFASDFDVASTWRMESLPYLTGEDTPIQPSVVKFIAQRLIINSQRNQFYFSTVPVNGEVQFTDQFGVPNFYSAEGSADAITSLTVSEDRIYLLGERSYEIWGLNTGDNTGENPFAKVNGSTNQIGIQAPRSLATIEDYVFFLGSSDAGRNSIFMVNGINKPIRISTNAIENTIKKIKDSQGAIGWCYYSEGHHFYVLTFVEAGRTFVYDMSTKLFHERSTRDWGTTTDRAWEPLYGVTAYNNVYHGGATSNSLILLDENKYTDYQDRPVIRIRESPVYFSQYNVLTVTDFYLDMEVGTTPELVGLGRDPQVLLDVSRDGGSSWTNFPWKSIGRQGDYTIAPKWSTLGSGRAISIRITFSDPSPIYIYGARLKSTESSTR